MRKLMMSARTEADVWKDAYERLSREYRAELYLNLKKDLRRLKWEADFYIAAILGWGCFVLSMLAHLA